jgi:predicted nucleic acid-binding protein
MGGCLDIELKEDSVALFDVFKAGSAKMIFSDLTVVELARTRHEIRNKVKEIPANYVMDVECTNAVCRLAEEYIRSGVLNCSDYHDAMHIALASVHEADVLATWNFKQMAEVGILNTINISMGHKAIDILSPKLILNSYERSEKL